MKGAIRCDLSTKSEIFSSCKLFSSDTQDRRTEKCSSWLLRRFQRRGNPIIVVLGDFTSQGQKDAQGSDTTVVCTLCSLLFLGKVSGLCAQFGKVSVLCAQFWKMSVLCAQFGKSVCFMCPVWGKCQFYVPSLGKCQFYVPSLGKVSVLCAQFGKSVSCICQFTHS